MKRYTCIGKGGEYQLGTATGAGNCAVYAPLVVYRDTRTGRIFFRTPDNFAERMQELPSESMPWPPLQLSVRLSDEDVQALHTWTAGVYEHYEKRLRTSKAALDEWFEKTDWVQKQQASFPFNTLGLHRADAMRQEIERLRAAAPAEEDVEHLAERMVRAVFTRPDLSQRGRDSIVPDLKSGADSLTLAWGDFLTLARLAAPQPPAAAEAGEFKLTRSIIHKCPAIMLPQSFAEKLGMMAQIVVLKGATDELAAELVDRLNAPTSPRAQAAGVEELANCLEELCDIIEGALEDGEIQHALREQIDSFTTQPARRALRALAATPSEKLAEPWHDGAPPHPWNQEWFIAETTFGDRVVLKALDKDYHSYDYTTADKTYFKGDKIKRWMQFPDSAYVTAPAAATPSEAAPAGQSEGVGAVGELDEDGFAPCPLPSCRDGHGVVGTGRTAAGYITLGCACCGLTMLGETKDEAVAKWNALPRLAASAPAAAGVQDGERVSMPLELTEAQLNDACWQVNRKFNYDPLPPDLMTLAWYALRYVAGKRLSTAPASEPVTEADKFCDANCTMTDHAAGCVRAEPVASEGAGAGDGWHLDDLAEAHESLTLLMDNIRRDGNYSADSTLNFLSPIKAAMDATLAAAQPTKEGGE